MSDATRRYHERAAGEGDRAAAVRALRARVRDGSLLPWRLELAAYAGDEAAFEALEPEGRAAVWEHVWKHFLPTEKGLTAALEPGSVELRLQVLCVALGTYAGRIAERYVREGVAAQSLAEAAKPLAFRATVADVRALESIARHMLESPEMRKHIPLGRIPGWAAALADALETGSEPPGLFLEVLRETGTGCVEPLLLPIAAQVGVELAAYLGVPGARAGRLPLRPFEPDKWLEGLERWGKSVFLRGFIAHNRGEIYDYHLPAFEKWVAEPAAGRVEIEAIGTGSRIFFPDHPLGLPDAKSVESVHDWIDGSGSYWDEGSDHELVDFALSGEPLFRFEGLEIHEELVSDNFRDAYRASEPGKEGERLLFALRQGVPWANLVEITRPLMRLDHPNLARLLRVGPEPKPGEKSLVPAFLVYERAFGTPLERWLAAERSLEERRALVRGILDGLEHAHARGVVHGSLGVESVVVAGGTPRIVDHGHTAMAQLGLSAVTGVAELTPEVIESVKASERERRRDPANDVPGAAALAARILGRPLEEKARFPSIAALRAAL